MVLQRAIRYQINLRGRAIIPKRAHMLMRLSLRNFLLLWSACLRKSWKQKIYMP